MKHHLLLRIVLLLLAALSLGGCAGMYFKDAGAPPPAEPRDPAHWPYREYWTGIVFNGAKIGFAHLTLAPAADAPGQYDIDSEAVFLLRYLGLEKKFVLKTHDRVHADLTLASFDYDLVMDGNRQQLTGTVTGHAVTTTVRTRDTEEQREFVATGPVYPASALPLYPLRHGLEVGREFRYTVFDGQLLKLAEARQRVEGYETSELFTGPAFKVSTRLHGHTTQTWINHDGKPVLELALNGVLISALEDEQRARRYLALASLNKQEVLLDFSRVAADRPIPAARTRHTLELALSGIDAARLPPADTVQTCAAGNGESICRVQSRPAGPVAMVDDPRYLGSTMTVPSLHPRIREHAAQITAGATGDSARIEKLVGWIQANIRREAIDVFSALDVLDGKKAECQGHAYLYAAFARSLNIPTRVVNGLVYMDEAQGFLYHSWNESLVDGRWRPVDPTFGQVVADATHVKLVEGENTADLMSLLDVIGRVKARVISYE